MSHDRARNQLTGPAEDVTPEQKRRASLVVAAHCPDPAERLEMLRMLDLAPAGFHWVNRHSHNAQTHRRVEDAPTTKGVR